MNEAIAITASIAVSASVLTLLGFCLSWFGRQALCLASKPCRKEAVHIVFVRKGE